MLNRLYIVIGVLAILVLGAGFLVPRFIDWNGYRARLEAFAEANLGTDVIIGGKIEFTLLPQPHIRFGKTTIGPAFSPILEIDSIVADFSLMDFLRDKFVVTNLVLQSPIVSLTINKNGNFQNPLNFPETFSGENFSISDAKIVNGTLRFADERSDQNWSYQQFEGDLSISNPLGPFSLRGQGVVEDQPYAVRLSISAFNSENMSQASFFWRSGSGDYTLSGEGVLRASDIPQFNGKVLFKAAPIFVGESDAVRGDFIFSSDFDVSLDRILLPTFELQPDENQAGSRLTGAAVIHLGENQNFDAVISGGVVSFVPLDIRDEAQNTSLELVDFLANLPAPVLPPIPGRIGVDIAELSVRNLAFRDVRLDAKLSRDGWQIENFIASLPGDSRLNLSGVVTGQDGRFQFVGKTSLQSERMGILARLWRQVDTTHPLHNSTGGIDARVNISQGILHVTDGNLSLDGNVHQFEGEFDLNNQRHASVDVRIAPIGAQETDILLALLPDVSRNNSFRNSFPTGDLSVTAAQINLFGLAGKSLALEMAWTPDEIHIERASALEFGGAQFSISGGNEGSFTLPNIFGGGRFTLTEQARDGLVPWLAAREMLNSKLQALLVNSLPLDVNFDISPKEDNGTQIFSAEGLSGEANVEVVMNFDGGLFHILDAPMTLTGTIHTENGDAFSEQFGLGNLGLIAQGGAIDLSVGADGVLSENINVSLMVRAEAEHIGYLGNVVFSDLQHIYGQGVLDFAVKDFAPLQELAGVTGVHLSGANGLVDVSLGLDGVLELSNLQMGNDEENRPVQGQFSIFQNGAQRLVKGQITTGEIDLIQILAAIAGPSSMIVGEQFWPVGPIDLGSVSRQIRGVLHVVSPKILVGDRVLLNQASFDFVWDETSVSLENIVGTSADGQVTGSLKICCTGLLAQKQVSGRLSLSQVASEAVFPHGVSQNVSGILDAGIIFETTGATIDEMVQALSGEGSFVLNDARLHRMDPGAFASLISTADIDAFDADALAVLVGLALDQGSFDTTQISGLFQIAGGKLRAENIAASNEDARVLGDIRVDLNVRALSGDWTLTPNKLDDAAGLIERNSAQITAILGGTLAAPTRVLNLSAMADAIELRALEIELDQLEALRAEQAARSAELALNRAKLMAADAERQAAQAEQIALEEAQARQARSAEEAAARQAADDAPMVFEFDSQDPLLQDPLFLTDSNVFTTQPTELLAQ